MKESKLKIQSTAMTLATKISTTSTVSPRNDRRAFTGPGEVKEDILCIHEASIEGKHNPRGSKQRELSSAHSLTNVAFPRGFTPSQCALLASRQRNSNYLYYNASNNWENVYAKPSSKETNVSKKRDFSSSLTHEVEARGVTSPSEPLAPMDHGRKSINGKTCLTGYFKWKSKEEIANYLAAHAQARLLWIQESEKMNQVIFKSEKDFNERRLNEKIRYSHQNPVYLFEKDSKKRF